MTSATQIVGAGAGGAYGAAGAGSYSRPVIGRLPQNDDAGRPGPAETAQPADRSGRRAPDPVRLPGQEGLPERGVARALNTGGAFTLAVAIGLALDQQTRPAEADGAGAAGGKPAEEDDGLDGLTEAERQVVEELKKRDAEVRRHEAAHAAAGGQYAGAPTFTYQTGPDGKRYAVGGEVSIDTAPVRGDPEATIRKAQQIKAAANAPADPSSQDRRVAAQADALRQQALSELAAEAREERRAEEVGSAEPSRTDAASGGPAPLEPGLGSREEGTDFADRDEQQRSTVDLSGSEAASAIGSGGELGSRAADAVARIAFSAAAASYRGPSETPRLLSIAV